MKSRYGVVVSEIKIWMGLMTYLSFDKEDPCQSGTVKWWLVWRKDDDEDRWKGYSPWWGTPSSLLPPLFNLFHKC